MAEPSPSTPIARNTLMPKVSTEQLGIARTPSGQTNLSLPNTIYTTSNISGGTVNNVYGDFHTNNYAPSPVVSINPASQPAQSLPPFNYAPIDRISSCFTGREPELEFISSSFRPSQSDKPTRFVIYGMPGLGKSQLALQHANLAFTSRDYSHIFWVSASTISSLSQGLTRILVLVNHAERNHPDQAVQLAAVCLWLEQSDRHGCRRWLLILDNVTAEGAMFLREHLPRQNASGSILITTRTSHIAESMANTAGQEHRVFELKALSRAQSANLLLRRAEIQSSAQIDLESAKKFVTRVGCLPLAVEQAGLYMKRSGIKSADQLQRLYDKRGVHEVLSWENNLTTYEEKSVLGTITMQLQSLDQMNPDAHKLVKVLAFFDPENIPLNILSLGARSIRNRIAENVEQSPTNVFPAPGPKVPAIRVLLKRLKGKEPNLPMSDTPAATDTIDPLEGVPSELRGLIELICSEERMRAVCRHLEELSIAQPLYESQPSLHIHGLIHLVLQQSTVHREDGYRNLAIALLCNAFQTIDNPKQPQSWDACEIYVPHFTALATQDETHSVSSEEHMHANESIAKYFYSRGRYSEAKTLLDRVLSDCRRLLGGNGVQTYSAMYSLAKVHSKLGRYEEAESLFVQVLAEDVKQLGVDHLNTLSTVDTLAGLYRSQGKLDEAGKLYEQALVGQEQHLGADHPSTLTTVHNLAGLYKSQRKFDEAAKLYVRVLAGDERQLGADHPSALKTASSLAGLYKNQMKFDEAEKLYVRALSGQEQQLGVDHPSTLTTVHSLAGLYKSRGEFDEAEKLYTRALAGQEQQLGVDHPSTLSTIHNLGDLYKSQRKFDEAAKLYVRVLAGDEKQLGADHPSSLTTASNLAGLYTRQGKFDEAEELFVRALAGQERQLGADHSSTLTTVHSLASLYKSQGKLDEAEKLYARALAGQEKQLGANHSSTLATVSGLAGLYEQQGEFGEAGKMYARALAGQQQQLGVDHPSTLSTVQNLAGLYKSQRKFAEATELYVRVLAGVEKQRADHPNTLIMVSSLAGLYKRQGISDEAEKLYVRVLAGQEQQLGADHPSTLKTVHSLAGLYKSQEKFDEAEKLYARALAGQEKQLGVDHPRTLMTIHNFAYLRKQQGRPQEAKVLYRRALIGQEAKLGSDHPDTLRTLANLAELYETEGRYEEAGELKARAT
ncbi:TPR-like protein [Athelia psychrophila]|uniref:TPR-like protein n=1 Tax=Athelia psychrophila TaxID=1759441 RepID=A0A166FA16_9AGAM|nr:TPR-like protein [Fibularhizoctonia sp. CBS 109695]